MRKNSLMAAAAVAALTIGTSITMAQSPGMSGQSGQHEKSGAPATSGPMSSPKAQTGATTGAGASTDSKSLDERGGSDRMGPVNKGAQQGTERTHERMGESTQGKRPGETTGQAPDERSGRMGKDDADKSRMGKDNDDKSGRSGQINRSGQDNHGKDGNIRGETTGQAPTERSGNMGRENDQMKSGAGPMNKSGQGAMDNDRDSARGRGAEGNVNLSSDQRTRIHEVIVKQKSAPRVANVDFSLNVGTAIPRSVKLVRVPSTIVEIEPAWRGYEYFMVGDQIVIVNPRTLEIVAVIEA
jgi:hypothetical protein